MLPLRESYPFRRAAANWGGSREPRRRAPPGAAAAHYESFYLKACAPDGGLGVWLRHTVLKPPGHPPTAALWCTLFDSAASGPLAVKQALPAARLARPPGAYIQVGDSRFAADRLSGGATAAGHAATWEIELAGGEAPLAHLRRAWLHRSPPPRTKLSSPRPGVRADGTVAVDGRRVELNGWSGMVGHNWGT